MAYVVITFVVLLFLNIYTSKMSQPIFYNSKETSMIERCLLTSAEIADLDVLNTTTVTEALSNIDNISISRLIVTDQPMVKTTTGKVNRFVEAKSL